VASIFQSLIQVASDTVLVYQSGDWPAAVGRFTAVVPRDYKRVMELIRTAEAAGRNVDEAVMGVKGA